MVLITLMTGIFITGISTYFIASALTGDGEDNNNTNPRYSDGSSPQGSGGVDVVPSEPIDITLLRTNFNDADMVYHFYYEDGPPDFDRHQIIDPNGFIELVAYRAQYGKISIYTHVPVVFFTEYSEITGNVYITAANPREVYDRIIIIDPGHGGSDTGAVVNNIDESSIVMDISRYLYQMFQHSDSGIRAFMTRHDDVNILNADRAHFASAIGDLLVSVHANTFVYDSRVTGTETLFAPHSYMDIYDNSGRVNMNNAAFARIMQDYVSTGLETRDRGIVERTDLGVLNSATIPAALIEIDFMTNPAVLANLTNSAHQQRVARAIYNGIVAAFNQASILE